MKMTITTILFGATLFSCFSCKQDLLNFEKGDIQIHIEKGDEWLHDFPLFMGIVRKNPPQVAIWIENMNGEYLSTVYVTHKAATQSWIMAGKNRRKEALPHWCHARNVQYGDGIYLPTKKEPLTDGISGATPKGSFQVKLSPTCSLEHFVVKIEINHSTDFNSYYPKSAQEGDANYSGGKEGSGQPALIYAVEVDRNSDIKEHTAKLIGHSSPDGSDGHIYTDLSTLTTALNIVNQITIRLQ